MYVVHMMRLHMHYIPLSLSLPLCMSHVDVVRLHNVQLLCGQNRSEACDEHTAGFSIMKSVRAGHRDDDAH